MIMLFFLFMIASFLFLCSLKHLNFDSFEIFILFMFASYICQTFFYMLSSPYERMIVVEEHFPFWITRMHFGIILPAAALWVMHFLRIRINLSLKLMICFCWISAKVSFEKFFLLVGVLKSHSESWYPSISIFVGMAELYACVVFMELSFSILKKEKVTHDESDL